MLHLVAAFVSLLPAPAADPPDAPPSVQVFPRDLPAFQAAAAGARVSISFEGALLGRDLSGQSVHGVTFIAPGSPLLVVPAADTKSPAAFFEDHHFWRKEDPALDGPGDPIQTVPVDATRARLPATTGAGILSPGGTRLAPGPDAAIEEDDLTLIFDPPIRAFGFDLLSQDRDGQSNTHIRVLDAAGVVLHEGGIPIGWSEAHAGGADFWGIVSPELNIARIEIDDRDTNNRYPDCNIGYDSLRLVPQPCPADLTGDGAADAADVILFVSLFDAAHADADLNADGNLDDTDRTLFAAALRESR